MTGSGSDVSGAAAEKNDGNDDPVYGVVTGEKRSEGRALVRKF